MIIYEPFFYPFAGSFYDYNYGANYGADSYVYVPPPSYSYPPVIPAGASGLTLRVDPSEAIVVVDGRELGIARSYDTVEHPLVLEPGTHDLELDYPGYLPLVTSFTVERDRVYSLDFTLQPE